MNAPLWSEIDDCLFQGVEPVGPENVLVARFDLLVLCWEESSPGWNRFSGYGFRVHRSAMFDDQRTLPKSNIPIAIVAGEVVAQAARTKQHVLVTCGQGMNRSGLVVALALRLIHGWSGAEAMRRVRDRRPGALYNPAFAAFLEELGKP